MKKVRRVRRRVKSEERKDVHNYIIRKVKSGEKLHFTLIDPEKVRTSEELSEVAKSLSEAGTDAFLVGGSVGVSEADVDRVVRALKPFKKPVILFPGNISGVSRYADAILFMSLMNSEDPYFIVEAAVLGSPLVYRYGLEVLPTAYIIVGYGGAAGFIGRARPIPYEKPDIGAAYVLAARYLGKKYIYLEAGSGAPKPIPPNFVKAAARVKGDALLMVGGGIKTPEAARELTKAGADIIVTGTVVEEDPRKAVEIIKAVKKP
jgi:phosphoglycerol geranylgeranyltransferase